MDLKSELENEVLLAILIEKRGVKGIDGNDSRELVAKIKGAMKSDESKTSATIPHVSAQEFEFVH